MSLMQDKYTMQDWKWLTCLVCVEKGKLTERLLKKGITPEEFFSLKQIKVADKFWLVFKLLGHPSTASYRLIEELRCSVLKWPARSVYVQLNSINLSPKTRRQVIKILKRYVKENTP